MSVFTGMPSAGANAYGSSPIGKDNVSSRSKSCWTEKRVNGPNTLRSAQIWVILFWVLFSFFFRLQLWQTFLGSWKSTDFSISHVFMRLSIDFWPMSEAFSKSLATSGLSDTPVYTQKRSLLLRSHWNGIRKFSTASTTFLTPFSLACTCDCYFLCIETSSHLKGCLNHIWY